MIRKLNHVNVFVLDQDRAKQFYTETLGFEVRSDAVLDGFRWLTVGPRDQPDLAILLAYPAPPMFSEDDAETVRALVAKGSLGGGVDSLKWLVHKVDLGVLGQCAGQEHPLLLPTGELADLAAGIAGHANFLQGFHRLLPLGTPGPTNPAERSVAAHLDDIEHVGGEVPIDAASLGNIGDD